MLISGVAPLVECGKYPIKRVPGEEIAVEADLVADSHDVLAGRLLWRARGAREFQVAPLEPLVNDRFRGRFRIDELGRFEVAIEGWVDELATFRHMLERKLEAGDPADVVAHLRHGARLLRALAARVPVTERARFEQAALRLDDAERDHAGAREAAFDAELLAASRAYPDPQRVTRWDGRLEVVVEPVRARFSSWYEFFPRSCGEAGAHGRLRDCEPRLRYAAELGFDVIYLPPIHPIGRSFRKGKNNALRAEPGDPGSPWAIGAEEGGHKAVHPELGTLEDFAWFLERARALGLDVALDIALQVSPDHPYVREHPEWFMRRPDGTIQYAENPPKKYQDIYPFDFECADAQGLWNELLSIFRFWIAQGVRIFRVDNPHTKSLRFWEFCIAELKRDHPDVVLLAEAFTRPKLMYALAKLGFSQSYTYFTWRQTKHELIEYFTELTRTEVAEFFRPNLWPNTPDILPEHLQFGGRAAFVSRLVLAATLGSSYGIYGPAFELMDSAARPGSGEYLDNEKYELKHWDVTRPDSLAPAIARLNAIRRDNPALHDTRNLRFHATDNDFLLCYSKRADDNLIVVVVSLDPHNAQSGFVTFDAGALGFEPSAPYQVHDLLGGGRYLWHGARNYVALTPARPAHVFRIRKRVRTEHDFDYFA